MVNPFMNVFSPRSPSATATAVLIAPETMARASLVQ